MGSALRLTVACASSREAQRVRDAAWREMADSDADLSRFRAGSSLTRANLTAGSGAWTRPSPRLRRLLMAARRAQRITKGRFDARIIGALEAIGESAGTTLPPATTREPWLERRSRHELRLASPVDSGGIGKGIALRWALAAARHAARGVSGLLLEAGGDIVAAGTGPENDAWSVGIEDPEHPEQLLATIALRDAAVATTSLAHRAWEHGGRRVHHLIDPRTGEPARTGLVAVSVSLGDPAWAETWTKALFLAGRDAIGPEARSRGLAAWWVEEDGSLHMTPAARSATTWIRGEVSAA
jgi:thiamine biosynthesis lipoprotein